MSITIVGGNDRMVRNYKDLCKQHNCKAKVFTQPSGLRDQIGSPDLLILFTNTVSHKMVNAALAYVSNSSTRVVRSHSSSLSSLKGILAEYAQ